MEDDAASSSKHGPEAQNGAVDMGTRHNDGMNGDHANNQHNQHNAPEWQEELPPIGIKEDG